MTMNFDGKTVLITGATSGIGRAAAERFAREGAHVIVSGRDQARGGEVVLGIKQAGGDARFIAADLGSKESVDALTQSAGQVDVLITSGGIFPFGPTHETPRETVEEVLSVNVAATFQLVSNLAPGMVQRGAGVIINVSTMVAAFGMPGMSAYGASKAAVNNLTQVWAAEYAPAVRVNAVSPGPTRTPGTEPMGDQLDQLATTLPLGRPAGAEEIAAAIVYLASDDASFITGAVVPVDGGRTAV
jgi:NAD(P)-dependent dehydrogenase (short-subunit alcohol dehydrogenase family)